MKRILLCSQLALALVTGSMGASAQATPQYTVVDLGLVGPPPGQPYTITGPGLISGEIVLAQSAVSHAFLWKQGKTKDIGSPGLGGPNSAAFGANLWGQVVGQADTTTADPNNEDFCGSTAQALTASGNTCEPFLWQNGGMTPLPRLRSSAGAEGSNGVALRINDFGIAAGTSENGESDSTCPGASVSPQSIEFKPVSGPDFSHGRARTLRSFERWMVTRTELPTPLTIAARWWAPPEPAGPSTPSS